MTELIWDGKYIHSKRQTPVRVALPFQTIETVNESVAERQRTLEWFAAGKQSEWRNRLIWGDKKYVLPSLLPEFAGKVNLIYIDPPFDTGADFSFTARVHPRLHDSDEEAVEFVKEPSIIEQKAYRDTWGRGLDSYIEWFWETASLLRELLHPTGSIYVHLDWHVGHYAKVALDEVFGSEFFKSEIIWKRTTSHSDSKAFGSVHDTILYYASPESRRNEVLQAYDPEYIEAYYRYREGTEGRRFMSADLSGDGQGPPRRFGKKGLINPPAGRHWMYDQEGIDRVLRENKIFWTRNGVPRLKKYLDESPGMPASDIWTDIQAVRSWHKDEATGYDTQKPESLLKRIIEASSDKGGLVLDCFAGSGTTAAVAEKLGRRWITCDLGRFSIHTARKRLLSVSGVQPFVVQNLGKYERQAWQSAEFAANESTDALEQQRQRETAYRKFILDLYHATPLQGHAWLHGIKAGRMLHVGAVDAPVTLSDIRSIAREVWQASNASGEGRKAAADILGWEFAFELNETARQIAAESRVDVAFKKIPREVLEKKAVEQGDIKFFELGALSVGSKTKKREVTIELTDFVIPIDDVPEEVRKAIKHWSQMIDYWAVDWDFKEDTFHNQWQSYRTRQDPKLELTAKYDYIEPGEYKVVVKVIDILGNDTTKTLDLKVQ